LSSWTIARSRLALAVRDGADSKIIDQRRRDLRAELLAKHIEEVVSAAPSLTAEQAERLAALLRPPGGG
jgi:hypothetical protein